MVRTTAEEGAASARSGTVHSADLLSRARAAATGADLEALTERAKDFGECVSIGTMPLAKGLVFKAVAVTACDDARPLQSRVADAADEDQLRAVFEAERHLFYLACTRARDKLHSGMD